MLVNVQASELTMSGSAEVSSKLLSPDFALG